MRNNMIRVALSAMAFIAALSVEAKIKYVFYFISDGTGVNIVQAGEHYRADVAGSVDGYSTLPYSFTQFPVVGMATTYSASTRVTDSAASGTALATGVKTMNGCIGVYPDSVTPAYSLCYYAKQKGMRVGVGTTVSIDHATPSSFYAHNKSRNNYHDIGHQLIDNDYVDFFGGGGFHSPKDNSHPDEPDLYELAEQKGTTVAYGYADYKAKAAKAKRILLVQTKDDMKKWGDAVPYVMDREPSSLKMEDILRAEIDFLMKGNPKNGFFLMNEIGGRVDYAAHSNDAATAFAELQGVDNCVKIALEFYNQHPDETLIVLTSDHDTGGISIGAGRYEMHPKVLVNQKISKDHFSSYIKKWRNERGENVITWDETKEVLKEKFGFWDKVKLSERQEKMLKDAYERTFVPNKDRSVQKGLYSSNEMISVVATRIIDEMADVSWAHSSHTGGFVPVFAIGKGSEAFHGMNDNAKIPKIIAKLLGVEMK